MKFNRHYNLIGQHAKFSASQPSWTNYSDEKLEARLVTMLAAQRGTELHAFAAFAIKLGEKLPRSPKTLNMYVNDAIGFRMEPEMVLYYSDHFFGTADAISFRKNLLRISDLKTGVHAANVRQLVVYAALFCLEYGFKPAEIEMEFRIYQNDEVQIYIGDYQEVTQVMSTIVAFDKKINAMKLAELD